MASPNTNKNAGVPTASPLRGNAAHNGSTESGPAEGKLEEAMTSHADETSRDAHDHAGTLPSGGAQDPYHNPEHDESTHSELDYNPFFTVRDYIVDGVKVTGVEIADCFFKAAMVPPITVESLAELDISRIINNPKLRHDVNFDRDLHFRPNLDGHKGREKIKQAEDYWKALQGELFMYARVQTGFAELTTHEEEIHWVAVLVESEKRLPDLLKTIRDILYTLVPESDQEAVMERLDIRFIMQEIKNGCCDLVDLAVWLARVLKCHCAPMRDRVVDMMRHEFITGAKEGRSDKLVRGISQLLTILEAMKLDVANHQIRHMRTLLIDDTVNFQRKYNAHRIDQGKIDLIRSRNWLEYEMATMQNNGLEPTHLDGLCSAILRGLLFPDSEYLPGTFYLDTDRLKLVSNDMRCVIYHQMIRDILEESTLRCQKPQRVFDHIAAVLKAKVTYIVGAGIKFVDRIEYIAAEIMRFVLEMEGAEPSVIDVGLMDHLERRLMLDLSLESSSYERIATHTFERVLPKLQASVANHARLPPLTLQNMLVRQLPIQFRPHIIGRGAAMQAPIVHPAGPVDPSSEDEIVRRLTHVIVLHWQIWAELVYLTPPPYDDSDSDSNNGGDAPTPPSPRPTSDSVSTVPIAEAVFEEGHRWLPVALTVKDVPSRAQTPKNPSADSDANANTDAQPPATGGCEQGEKGASGQSSLDSEQ